MKIRLWPLAPWETLTPARRGWAVGSVFGLLVTIFYYIGPGLWGHYGVINFFSFLSIPATPGILIAEQLMNLPVPALHENGTIARACYAGFSGGANYILWGGYLALVYRAIHWNHIQDVRMVGFCLFTFFWSVVGMAYALNSGVIFNEVSADSVILLIALFLALLSLAPVFAYLIDQPTQMR